MFYVNDSMATSEDQVQLGDSKANPFTVAQRMCLREALQLLFRAQLVKKHPLLFAVVENDFESFALLLKYNLCDTNKIHNVRPDILCYVLRQTVKKKVPIPSALEFVRELCRLKMNVNRCQYCKDTRVELALKTGSYGLAEVLCAHGAQITYNDLLSAVKSQRFQMVPLLVDHGAPVDPHDHSGHVTCKKSALDLALESSSTSTARVLLQHGAQIDAETAFTQALKKRNAQTLKLLLTECVKQTKAVIQKPEILIEAVKLRDIHLIQLLLDAGADIDGVHDNETPLMSAVHTEVINFLLNKGANVNLKTNTTPLINLLSWKFQRDFGSAFHPKLTSEEMDEHLLVLIGMFLEKGANLDDTDEDGNTALIKTVRNKCGLKVLKYLLDRGADLGHDDNQQKSALSIVLNDFFFHEEAQLTATLLIDHGASSEFVRRDIIHGLIAAGNNGLLIQKLMKSGVCPLDIVLNRNTVKWPEKSVSPLAVSLILENADFVRYFIENWFLTKSDITLLSRNKKFINCLQPRRIQALTYLKEVSRQPMRLELLCFITVSTALGSDRGRRLRVHNSRLPVPIQNKLLFLKVEEKVLEEVTEEGIKFLWELPQMD